MNIDLMQIITEMGGGFPAVAIVGLALTVWSERKRNRELTDKFIELGQSQTNAINDLARQIERANQK